MRIRTAAKKDAVSVVSRLVYETNVCLDIGPGIQPQAYTNARTHLLAEPHAPYLERVMRDRGADPKYVPLRGTWQEVLRLLPDNAVDSAFALDLIEHLEKSEGHLLIKELTRVSRHQVLIFTPRGFYPQTYTESDTDAWGMTGGHWQTHRSGWEPEEFLEMGTEWQAVVSPDFHEVDQYQRKLAEPWPAFWALFTKQPTSTLETSWDRAQKRSGRLGRFPSWVRGPVRRVLSVMKSA